MTRYPERGDLDASQWHQSRCYRWRCAPLQEYSQVCDVRQLKCGQLLVAHPLHYSRYFWKHICVPLLSRIRCLATGIRNTSKTWVFIGYALPRSMNGMSPERISLYATEKPSVRWLHVKEGPRDDGYALAEAKGLPGAHIQPTSLLVGPRRQTGAHDRGCKLLLYTGISSRILRPMMTHYGEPEARG